MKALSMDKQVSIQQEKPCSKKHRVLVLFICFILFKLACDWGYWQILTVDTVSYTKSFNLLKYINGLIWCVVLFVCIRHNQHKVSSFMLSLVLFMQIVPITTIYALGNDSAEYYNELCLAFLLCEILVGWVLNRPKVMRNHGISKLMMLSLIGMYLLLVIVLVQRNGDPSLIALDIYKVYELRSSGIFNNGGKYMGYMLTWCMQAIVPFILAKALLSKRYLISLILCGLTLLIYLYCGHKQYLFFIPVAVICGLWSKRKNFYYELYITGCICFLVLVFSAQYSPIKKSLFEKAYSLVGRRLMILSANIKFDYFDFFSANPKLGMAGVFPRWLINVPNTYADISYPKLIGEIYYNAPQMYVNTGFFAEGYMRFGHIGTFIVMGLFALVIRLMDRMQQRVGYALTVTAFVYPVLMLTDAHLFDSIVLGPWMFIIFILLLYTEGKNAMARKLPSVA